MKQTIRLYTDLAKTSEVFFCLSAAGSYQEVIASREYDEAISSLTPGLPRRTFGAPRNDKIERWL